MNFVLGTVQFGLDYGINNVRGKIPREEAYRILKFAYDKGINFLDTAYDYGDSQKVIGEFIKDYGCKFDIISKISVERDTIYGNLEKTLKYLNVSQLYGLLVHDFNCFLERKEETINVLKELKLQGKVKKIGFSLYHPEELEFLLDKKYDIDIAQIPFNVFDQRFGELLPELRRRNIEVHARSVFLQGLFFKDLDRLEGKFFGIKEKISRLHYISCSKNIPISALCMNFVLLNDCVDRVIVGVDSLSQLKENLDITDYKEEVTELYNDLVNLREDKEDYILPYKWVQV